jgi:hypothetical protein
MARRVHPLTHPTGIPSGRPAVGAVGQDAQGFFESLSICHPVENPADDARKVSPTSVQFKGEILLRALNW